MADARAPDLPELTTVADDDYVYVVDKSDTTDTAAGTSKYAQVSNLARWPITAAETSAGVTPTNYQYEPGNILRYGANTTEGVTDMTAAFVSAISVSQRVMVPKGNYAVTNISLTTGTMLVGNDCAQANSTDAYDTNITHIAASSSDIITIESASASTYIQAGGVKNISIISNANTRYGIYMRNPLGARIDRVIGTGSYTGAFIAIKGSLNATLRDVNFLSASATQTPAGVLVLSWDGDLVGTTLKLERVYVHGHATTAASGILNAVKWEPAACIDTVLTDCIFESISGTVVDINKGNRVWVYNQYLENVPNTNLASAIFEVGVTGAADPNDDFDTVTALHIQGGLHAGFSGSPTTNIEYINADVCEELTIDNVNVSRVATLLTGTNNTQRVRASRVQAPNLTTVFSGLTTQKVHVFGANVLGTSDWGGYANFGTIAEQGSIASNTLHNGFPFWATNLGNGGGLKIYDKTNTAWKTPAADFSAAPTVGAWIRGDIVNHTNALGGRPMGWACVTSGSPGSWVELPQAGYRSGSGSPSGSIAPLMVGEEYLDTTGSAWYKSYGTGNTDWQAL